MRAGALWHSPYAWRAVIAAIVVLSLIGLALRAEATAVRYAAEPCRWADLTAHAPEPVHVALFGSSRMAAAFAPGSRFGPSGLQLNLARTYNGLGHVAISVRDLLAQRPVRHIVIAYDPQVPSHPWPGFPLLASWQELWSEVWVQDPTQFGRLAANKILWAGTPAALSPQPEDCRRVWPIRPDILSGPPPASPQALDATSLLSERDRLWLQAIRHEAGRSATTVTIVQIPARGQTPWPEQVRAAASQRTGVRWISPPESVFRALALFGYADNRHVNLAGRQVLQAWLDDAF